jgi:hypothetical protein
MAKLNIEIDKEDIPVERIRKHKNFQNFLTQYHAYHTPAGIAKLWYRNKRLLAWIAILACLLLMGLFAAIDEEEAQEKRPKDTPASTR